MNPKSPIIPSLRRTREGFTLTELLVSIVVVVIIALMSTQLLTSTTAITRTAHKYVDTDTQARVVFDRMALDFAQMLKRTDIDYYVKQPVGYKGHGNGHGGGNGKNGDIGSDQIAFFSAVPGYYPSGYNTGQQSPISLVAYRVNESSSSDPAYGRLVRMAKGLGWNAIDNSPNQNDPYPIVFATGQVVDCNGNCPCNSTTGPWAFAGPTGWSGAICNDDKASSRDNDYEVIGPGVFRFEYYYLLKSGFLTDWPWDKRDDQFSNQQTIYSPIPIGLSQIEAIGVTIAVIDPAGRKLIDALNPDRIVDLAGDFPDFKSAHGVGNGNQAKKIGDLEDRWKDILESTAQTGRSPSGLVIPAAAAKGIRIYSRYFDLKTL